MQPTPVILRKPSVQDRLDPANRLIELAVLFAIVQLSKAYL
jgi:hypothetical protein